MLKWGGVLEELETTQNFPNRSALHRPSTISVVLVSSGQKDESKSLEKDIERHEDNIKFLQSLRNRLDLAVLDLQANLGKHYSGSAPKNGVQDVEEETTKQILQQQDTAASALCRARTYHALQASNLALTKDVVGVVATLARVGDSNLSRLLSEYLGLEMMLGIVCRTLEGVKALENYDEEGKVNTSTGLPGLASSIGRRIRGRFVVICLEELRPYVGGAIAKDPQRRLALLKPKLPNGECPSGFLGFAVNLINIDIRNLSYVTADGCGLREKLFYNLFSHLQVYKTRNEMLLALPSITHGALSLDGGMIKTNGVFALGSRKDVEVQFPLIPEGSDMYTATEAMMQTEFRTKKLTSARLYIHEDMRREQLLLEKTKDQATRQHS